MLLDIRETVRNSKPIKYTLITLISIPFALVGIGSYFSGGNVASVAEVAGVEIGQQELDRAYNQQRQRLAQMFGGQIPEGFANEELLRQQALEGLIEQQVIRSEVENQGLAVGDATLGREIRNLPVFQVDGRFDNDTYRNQLRAMGSSVAGFEQQFRDDTAINQFRVGITDTSFRLPAEQARLEALSRQTRTIDYLRFDIEAVKQGIELDEKEIQAWFDERAEQYQFPPRVKLAWLELERSELAKGIDVTDEEAQAWYEDNRSRYMKPAVREASHILITLEEDADEEAVAAAREQLLDARQRVEGGESFADLAKEMSEDVGSADAGGSLGSITPGTMVDEFEDALNTLDTEGQMSEPVRSEFGMHLIRLDAIQPESGKPFEAVKDEILTAVKADRAGQEFSELRELLSELTFDNPESLEVAAEETGLTVQESDWVDNTTEGDTVATDPQVLQAAFGEEVLDEGNNSDIIELGENRAVVVRVREHEGPRPQTLDDVRDTVVDAIKSDKAGEQLDALMAEKKAQLDQGEAVEALAESDEFITAVSAETLGRDSDTFGGQVLTDIFALPRPKDDAIVTGSSTLAAGDRLLYRLIEVAVPEDGEGDQVADDAEQVAGTEAGSEADAPAGSEPGGQEAPATVAAPQLGNVEFGALVSSLRERTDVEVLQ